MANVETRDPKHGSSPANLQVRKVDPVPALTLSGFQAWGGDRVHLPYLQITLGGFWFSPLLSLY